MSGWTRRHQALLDALRADRVWPTLYTNLAGAASGDSQRTGALRDWVISMRADPGWSVLEHVWDKPGAFPAAWDAATELGWSGRTEHHNALLFEEWALAHLREGRLAQATWCWSHCLRAWDACARSEHYRQLLETLEAGADASVVAQANRRVLEPAAEALGGALRRSLALDADTTLSADANRAEQILTLIRRLGDRSPNAPNSPVQHGAATMRTNLRDIADDIVSDFERGVDRVDFVEDTRADFLAPFEQLGSRFEALEISDDVAIAVIDTTVSSIWSLRKLDRLDEDTLTCAILEATEPFAEVLIDALHDGRAMGRQSLAADFLVFRGEQLDGIDEREYTFERALSVCPGHRNASMMLSYLRLAQAHTFIVELQMVPGTLSRLGPAADRLDANVKTAHSYVEDAARIYPNNDELPAYREDVRDLAERFNVDL